MLARVVCDKCKRDLKIKRVIQEAVGTVIVIECCNGSECSKQIPEKDPQYEKHLSDMLRTDPPNDLFIGKDI